MDSLNDKVEELLHLKSSKIIDMGKSIKVLDKEKTDFANQIEEEKKFLHFLLKLRDMNDVEEEKEDEENLRQLLRDITLEELNAKVKEMVEDFRNNLRA